MNFDRFDTPPAIAREAFESLNGHFCEKGPVVLDPAAGGGALLEPFADELGSANIIALDIDPSAVADLVARRPKWEVRRSDFIGDSSVSSLLPVLRDRGADVVVLNPPFSEKGAATTAVSFGETNLRCGRSMAFLLRAAAATASTGAMAALMPASALKAEKNLHALELLSALGKYEVVERYPSRAFKGVVASTVLVRWKPASRPDPRGPRPSDSAEASPEIVRGWVQMHSRSTRTGPWRPLIHSTDLSHLGSERPLRKVRSQRSLSGPCVLLPRVGRPNAAQFVVLEADSPAALSDCVLALPLRSGAEAEAVAVALADRIDQLRDLYSASCAPYVTLQRLSGWLASSIPQCGGPADRFCVERMSSPGTRTTDRDR